jgi:hypothetical protein
VAAYHPILAPPSL